MKLKMLSNSLFCCPQQQQQQWRPNSLWLNLLLLRVGFLFLIGSLPHHANGLECYDCKHGVTIPEFLPDRPPKNKDCIKPSSSKNLNRTTCTDPNESCFTGHAAGDYGGIKVKLLFRQCFLPKSGQKGADGCIDFKGIAFGSNDTIYWGERSLVEPEMPSEMLKTFLKSARAKAKAEGKQTDPNVNIAGTYCLCSGKDLCNDELAKEWGDPDAAIPADNGQSPELKAKASWSQLIFFLWIEIIVSLDAFSI